MFNKKLKKAICVMSSAVMIGTMAAPATSFAAVLPDNTNTNYKATTISNSDLKNNDVYAQRFAELYNIVKGDNSPYFNEQGVPYHSIETLMVEAPDQGHESTSEAASYYGWIEAMRGSLTGDYSTIGDAWDCIDNYFVPTAKDQPGQDKYNPAKPATYASEYGDPSNYPSKLMFSTSVGQDPLYYELEYVYNTSNIYGMHWLIDVDNFYGYGKRGDGTSTPSYINTYQRGKQESVFETIPQPSWEEFKWGGSNGYLDLFTQDSNYSKQWRYTNAPDADARLIQAMYGAAQYAKEDGQDISKYIDNSAEMGDYLRYSMFDKYFMKIGAQGKTPASGRDSQHYLLSWYYSWGGGIGANWSWRIGCSHSHFGYQNPMAAYVLSNENEFVPKSQTAKGDWDKSLQRQIELYTWLQSEEGGIAGGCTNSWNGSYDSYPSGKATFYGMAYTEHPVYEDPGSNRWFGMQAWSMQRMCEYYYTTGDPQVKPLVEKWAQWAAENVELKADGTFAIPSNLRWVGQPDNWNDGQTVGNWNGSSNLHCYVDTTSEDVGVAGSLANALTYYAAAVKKYDAANFDADGQPVLDKAEGLLDSLYNNYTDEQGVASKGMWDGVKRFFEQEVYVPAGFSGTMPNGDQIKPGVTFYELRTNYKNDKDFDACLAAYQAGKDFETNYHRFWAQAEVLVANGVMSQLFGTEASTPTPTPSPSPSPSPSVEPSPSPSPSVVPSPSPSPSVVPSPSPSPSVVPSPSPSPSTPAGQDWIEVISPKGQDSTNTLGGEFKVKNNGSAVKINNCTFRYYFKTEGNSPIKAYVDNVGFQCNKAPWYASLGSKTTATIVKMTNPTATADTYLEVKIDSDLEFTGADKLSFQIRVAKTDWSNFDQTNDYSFTNGAVALLTVGGDLPC